MKNIIKKIILILGFITLLSGVVLAVDSSLIIEKDLLRVSLLSQDPDPAEPANYVELRFKIENIGAGTSDAVLFEIIPEYPFSLNPGESSVKQFGKIYGNTIDEDGVIVHYKLRIDKNAIEGDNDIKARYKVGNDSWRELDPFTVRIKTHDAILSVLSVESEPSQVEPGKSLSVSIKIKNMADSIIKDIKIKLDLVKILQTTSTISYVELPFSPVGSTNEKTIKQLDSKEDKLIKFNLIADSDAESKVYKIPLKISYLDGLGENYTKDLIIGVVVGKTPELSTVIDSSDIYKTEMSGRIIVKFVNKGVNDIKFLNIKIKNGTDYVVLSQKEVYVGNLDSDDYETAEFKLFIKKTDKKEIELPFDIEYLDANNNHYSKNITLPLRLYSLKEAREMGIVKKNNTIGIIILIAIIVLGLVVYKKFKKNK